MTTALARLRPYLPLLGIAILAYALLVWAPGTMTPFRLGNLGKYCALALASMGIGLAWGRGGMLVLGQGVFFGLGAYAMAMHMKLEAAGLGMGEVVKTTCFLRHMTDYARMNEIYTDAFGDHRPARSAIGVAELPLGALFEVEAWARRVPTS